METYDILIIGAGVVGTTMALALARSTSLKIALVDSGSLSSSWQPHQVETKVSAISLASQRLFERLEAWPLMQARRVSIYEKMHVWDAENPGCLDFDSQAIGLSSLGCIVEDAVIKASLMECCAEYPQLTLYGEAQLASWQEMENHMVVSTHSMTLSASLVIAADGAQSWVREQAQISMSSESYECSAIVTTVHTEHSHQRTAWQRFLPSGPLAFLPLKHEHQASIVWSLPNKEAQSLLTLEKATLATQLTRAIEARLGNVVLPHELHCFPLQTHHVDHYIKPRLVLIGDSAHTVHPLAGQGVNLGLQDVMSLLEVIKNAIKDQRDFASHAVLRKYERARKAENQLMLQFVDGLHRIFGSQQSMLKGLRHLGMKVTNNTPWIKNKFIRYAIGERFF